MTAPPSGACGRSMTRLGQHRPAVDGGVHAGVGAGVGEAADGRAGGHPFAAFADRVGQCHQVIFVGMGGQRPRVPHQLPAARGGDSAGMGDAQIPGMWFTNSRQGPDDSRRIRVDEGQRRHGIVRAPGPAAATGNIHVREAIALHGPRTAGHAQSSPW
jgi:hypothetical protein